MPFLTKITALLICSTLAIAAPFADTVKHQPDPVEKRAAGTLTALVTATPGGGGEYITPIQINGVTKNVLLDTGSTDLWIKGSGSGPAWSVNYGSGQVSGTWTTGTVTVGGMTLTGQAYGQATAWASDYNSYDGILGLSPYLQQFNSASAPSWLKNIMPKLAQQVFAVNLASNGGTISFGYTEPAHEATTPVYFPSTSANAWYLNVTSFGVPSGDTSMNCLIDTGTTDIYVPQSVAQAYWGQVQGATTTDNKKWQFPCSSTVPDFVPHIGGQSITIPGSANIFNLGGGQCGSRLQSTPSGCIFGQGFFFGQYTIYDFASTSIGLSKRK